MGIGSLTVAALPPLPYVQGGSRWWYRSDMGQVQVQLDDLPPQPEQGVRRYRWRIDLLGVAMEEELSLTADGLFVVARRFLMPLVGTTTTVHFLRPELTVALPLEVGRHWSSVTPISLGEPPAHATPTDAGPTSQVEGVVEALETVEVPAGRYAAYRIRLHRTDTTGTVMDSVIWLSPRHGVIRATGHMRWPGLVGRVQQTLGLDRLHLELADLHVVPPPGAPPAPVSPAAPGEGR